MLCYAPGDMPPGTAGSSLPMPPMELRYQIGPLDDADYDNPGGMPILDAFGVPHDAYRAVFDFGCGCGRQARQMLQQRVRPRRYLGIDIQRRVIDWCRNNLATADPAFEFLHHDVYAPWYAPENSLRLALPLPAADQSFSLVVATSVFTHLTRSQVEFYLSEVARILTADGVAFTTWLFFDRASFAFHPEVYSLYISEADFAQAVVFDREWFLETVRALGLGVQRTFLPEVAGHQWTVLLVRRSPGMADDFPLGADGAEFVAGATLKPIATAPPGEIAARHHKVLPLRVIQGRPPQPELFGALRELDAMRRTQAWRIGRALTAPVRRLRAMMGRT